jgi:hypothetical protein
VLKSPQKTNSRLCDKNFDVASTSKVSVFTLYCIINRMEIAIGHMISNHSQRPVSRNI